VSRPKRSLGQNFLVDPSMARRIVEASRAAPGDALLEIGPGRGALTSLLVPLGRPLVLLEKDDGLAGRLEATYASTPSVTVIRGDAMRVDLQALPLELPRTVGEGRAFRVVANLPYNVASRIALRMLAWGAFGDATFTFQKEVAVRFAAVPGSRDYGALSVMARVYADPYLLFPIPPGAFRPRPRVLSHVVRFRVLDEPRIPADELASFERVVRGVFQTRRKTILNSLSRLAEGRIDGDACRGALDEAGIDPAARAETVSLERFAVLARAVRPELPAEDAT
jgi:16S rRNA (adenine1518-N6/adenine1519-N6)-dimethyltransferase